MSFRTKRLSVLLPVIFTGLLTCSATSKVSAADYAIVVSKTTYADAGWKKVVQALVKKHGGELIRYEKSVDDALPMLKKQFPRYTCFVATPKEAGKNFVKQVHRLTRQFDNDPYIDTRWAILTGYDAKNALSIAQYTKPLTVKKVAAGTDVALEMCDEGICYDELVKFKKVVKLPGGTAKQSKGPGDTTAALADTLTKYNADLFVTSGHACTKHWQIGFRYLNGYFKSKNGQMFGADTNGKTFSIASKHPRVYLPIGNCSMGNIDGKDAMALAWLNSCGVKQMIGYVEPTWFGYAGWGCLDYFVEQPGRYTLVEAFHANHHSLIHKLAEVTDRQNQRGLTFDRDVVALYGDPKWEARMAKGNCAYEQTLTEKNGVYTLTITPKRGADSFKPINTNGSQRGWRPIVEFLPKRLKSIEIISGKQFKPVITDDFILVPNPRTCDPKVTYQIVFRAKQIK